MPHNLFFAVLIFPTERFIYCPSRRQKSAVLNWHPLFGQFKADNLIEVGGAHADVERILSDKE